MFIQYGTAGFRYHHIIIEQIASKIGMGMLLLLCQLQTDFGIMITASHNHYQDNGIKILDNLGNMLSKEMEEFIETIVNNDQPYIDELLCNINEKFAFKNTLHIGYDSRKSGPGICSYIMQGFRKINTTINIQIHPHITTPEMHYIFSYCKNTVSYRQYVLNVVQHIEYPCILDCANGIGGKLLEELVLPTNIHLVNTSWKKYELLNTNCSSDFVCSHKKLPDQDTHIEIDGVLCASLDGDADRVVFYFQENGIFQLLNGDYIAALLLTYINELILTKQNAYLPPIRVGFIYTGYTNGACIKYVEDLYAINSYAKLYCICTPTGVKHLHKKALDYDISVYFEQNGHGNVIINTDLYESFNNLSRLFHPNIGDGILDGFAVLYVLQELSWDHRKWATLYSPRKSKMGKMHVLDKTQYVCNEDETQLITPLHIQQIIIEFCREYSARAFMRPSGTENMVRLYVECDSVFLNGIDILYWTLLKRIIGCDEIQEFKSKDYTFLQRKLNKIDMNPQYFTLLGMLSTINVKAMDEVQCKEFVEGLHKNHQIIIFQDCASRTIVATGTLLVETKLLHNFGKVGHIEDIVIHTDYRKHGLGKRMVHALTSISSELGCYKTILDCSEENSGFYEKCDFEIKGTQMAKYHE
jgi:phosphoacetylglucosamine mutase